MPIVKVFDQQKNEVGELELAQDVFEVEIRPEILHLVVRSQLAARRSGTHSTKTRSFVSGGGKKPWKQKGTGRARAGSNRSPVWRHGGVAHGPHPRKYEVKVNKKVRALALKMALSSKLSRGNLMVLDRIELAEVKTKLFAGMAKNLGLEKALFITAAEDRNLNLSARNVPGMKIMTADKLNVFDVLKHHQLVLLQGAAKNVEERFK